MKPPTIDYDSYDADCLRLRVLILFYDDLGDEYLRGRQNSVGTTEHEKENVKWNPLQTVRAGPG